MNDTAFDNFNALFTPDGSPWIPFSVDVGAFPGLTAPIQRLFEEKTGHKNASEYFDTDYRIYSIQTRFGGDDPRRFHTDPIPHSVHFDEWGIGHVPSSENATVDHTLPPLKNISSAKEAESLPLPIIDSTPDTNQIEIYHQKGYPVFGYAGSIYEWSWWIRGMENFMMDVALNPVLAEALIEKIKTHTLNLSLASAKAGIDVLCFYDDAGTQQNMQVSPQVWRTLIKPAWKEVLDTVKSKYPKVKTFLHSCGKIDAIVPDVVELGFDILHPIQPECMDFESIYKTYGRHIILCSTLSCQQLFPFGTPEEIKKCVRYLAQRCPEKRTLLCPSNLLQPETPWENILAFVDAAQNLKRN